MLTVRLFPLLAFLLVGCAHTDIEVPDSSTTNSWDSAVAQPEPTSCDQKKILCRRATPQCAEGEVPSVIGSCYGPCVPIEQCACNQASDCPNPDSYTCHMYAHHCGPFVN